MLVETEIIFNGEHFTHIISDLGNYIRRSDNTILTEVLSPENDEYTYTETEDPIEGQSSSIYGVVTPDWAETNINSPSYIRNKPDIFSKQDVLGLISNYYTKDESDNIISILPTKDYVTEAVKHAPAGLRLGQIIESTYPRTDSQLHILDGSILYPDRYKEFCDFMNTEYQKYVSNIDTNVQFTPDVGINTNGETVIYFEMDNRITMSDSEGTLVSSASVPNSIYKLTQENYYISFSNFTQYTDLSIGLRTGHCIPKKVIIQSYNDINFTINTSVRTSKQVTQSIDSTSQTVFITTIEFTDFQEANDIVINAVPVTTSETYTILNIQAVYDRYNYDDTYFVSNDRYNTIINRYGICSKLVYSTSKNWVRIPTLGNILQTKDLQVPTTLPIAGDGKSLGLTNGVYNFGMTVDNLSAVYTYSGPYGNNVQSNLSNKGNKTPINSFLGVTTDSSKSGIVVQTNNFVPSDSTQEMFYYMVVRTEQ